MEFLPSFYEDGKNKETKRILKEPFRVAEMEEKSKHKERGLLLSGPPLSHLF